MNPLPSDDSIGDAQYSPLENASNRGVHGTNSRLAKGAVSTGARGLKRNTIETDNSILEQYQDQYCLLDRRTGTSPRKAISIRSRDHLLGLLSPADNPQVISSVSYEDAPEDEVFDTRMSQQEEYVSCLQAFSIREERKSVQPNKKILSCNCCGDLLHEGMGEAKERELMRAAKVTLRSTSIDFGPSITLGPHTILLMRNKEQSVVKQKVYEECVLKRYVISPPCECISCQELLWSKAGFNGFADHELATVKVREWVSLTLAYSRSIASTLATHEEFLKRCRAKRRPNQKRRFLQELSRDWPSFAGVAKSIGAKKTSARSITEKRGSVPLISNLNIDHLATNPDVLFEHLHARCKNHPALLFLSDLMLGSAAAHDGLIDLDWTAGTFNITSSRYGVWQEWAEQPVHRFKAVTASWASQVFCLQARILGLLYRIVDDLMSELPKTGSRHADYPERIGCCSQSYPALPTCIEFESLYMKPFVSHLSLHNVSDLIRQHSRRVVDALTVLRAENRAFIHRIEASREFQRETTKPEDSSIAWIAYHVLAEPHDRVLVWMNIISQMNTLSYIHKNLGPESQDYAKCLRTLLLMLDHRLIKMTKAAVLRITDSTVVALLKQHEYLGEHFNLLDWLQTFFSADMWSWHRYNTTSFMQRFFEQHAEISQSLNLLVKEWIEETATVVRILEVLKICEPMFSSYLAEATEDQTTIWFRVSPECGPSSLYEDLKQRSQAIKEILQPDATLNSASKQKKARKQVQEAWEEYNEATQGYFASYNVPADWSDAFENVMTLTEPDVEMVTWLAPPQTPTLPKIELSTLPFTLSSIPHHSANGPESPVFKKVTKRKRDELKRIESSQEDVQTVSGLDRMSSSQPSDDTTDDAEEASVSSTIEIPIKRCYLPVVESLFSGAQKHVSSVRFPRFVRFMIDAGLTEEQGSCNVIFEGRNAITGLRASVSLHRPHPDSTLRAVHLRNYRDTIREQFGWKKKMFRIRS